MAKVRLILDRRRATAAGQYPVRLYVYHKAQMLISTGINIDERDWNDAAGLLRGNDAQARAKNARLRDIVNRVEMLLLQLSINDELGKLSTKGLRVQIERELGIGASRGATLLSYFDAAKKGKAERTCRLFDWAKKAVEAHDADARVGDIDETWCMKLRDEMLREYAPNTVAQFMAKLSRALSIAVTEGVIARNPCAGVKKPRAATRKKSLSLEKLRQLRDMELTGARAMARDVFMLQFYLIGINTVDLYDLTEIVDGRIEYKRHKTKTLYSVKVEPEALALIEKMRGGGRLVELRCGNSASQCTRLTLSLGKIIPKLSTNWARHTWATIAAELEIPMETVSHALGHKIGSPVTAIYVAFNQKKVDDANRRVIDYVNADLQAAGKGKK